MRWKRFSLEKGNTVSNFIATIAGMKEQSEKAIIFVIKDIFVTLNAMPIIANSIFLRKNITVMERGFRRRNGNAGRNVGRCLIMRYGTGRSSGNHVG